jgi:hypothetical protein
MSTISITSITSATTIPQGQSGIAYIVDASSAGFTITMPDATSNDGDNFWVKRIDSVVVNTVTISAQSPQKIDGAASVTLTKNKFYQFLCYSGNWYIIG